MRRTSPLILLLPARADREPITMHLLGCDCAACNPPVPSDAEPSVLRALAEMAGTLAIGLASALLTDWALGGPGIQIMFGWPA